ncbi:MAG: hypothetical protein KatS3mg030_266 [Saprospiraceae bacterium]|nr:MAG: hypothetical protein KatS3mg030_266 [Saprospiraceae bacterium]
MEKAERYVVDLLSTHLTPDHKYHDVAHTLAVRDAARQLAEMYRLSEEEQALLELAALFHDTGYVRQYEDHEEHSKQIATEFLSKEGVDEETIARVTRLIEVTKVGVEPKTLIEKVIKDADFNTLTGSYEEKAEALRHEWKVFKNLDMKDEEWLENNLQFWNEHQFYTGEANALYGDQKRQTLKKLKKQREKLQLEKAKQSLYQLPSDKELEFAINKSKSAQMMFKTTLRNQIDLTNIADNKANIMLSINSLLITLGIPLLLPKVMEDPKLALPAGCLLLTCILSIVFATMATRPVKMTGVTDLKAIEEGRSNLFFFGNFYKMDIDDYRRALHRVLLDDQLLDASIVNDLYFLGRTLGNKYRRLRITYNIFMIGMICTVIAFAVVLLLG